MTSAAGRARGDGSPESAIGTTSQREFLLTLGALVGLVGLLLTFDLWLARVEGSEAHERAAMLYHQGRAQLAAGAPFKAGDRLSSAVSLDRTNVTYALALTQATLAQGRFADAERMLTALLDRAQNDGAVNLTMARLLASTSRSREARAFYHRAIYGRWGADSIAQRAAARFELIDLLTRENDAGALLAELLPLQADSADTVRLLTRVGPLYLRADAPGRAADAFRVLIHRSPDNAMAWSGLGDAALALGQFITAHSAFRNGVRLAPHDSAIARKLALADTLLALDPTARGLSDIQRLDRSQSVLARTLEMTEACIAEAILPGSNVSKPGDAKSMTPAIDSAFARIVRDSIVAELRVRPSSRGIVVATERKLALAGALWRTRPAACIETASLATEALAILHRALAK